MQRSALCRLAIRSDRSPPLHLADVLRGVGDLVGRVALTSPRS